jgi:hypothetical protein
VATTTQRETGSVLDQAARTVNQVLDELVIAAARAAEICGCPGCLAKSVEATAWGAEMLSVEETNS